MKRIKFIARCIFETHGPGSPDNPIFEIEQIEVMRDDQAQRWLKRRKAEVIDDLGPDEDPVLAGTDPAKVAEIRDAVVRDVNQRLDELTGDMADDLNEAAKSLQLAMIV